MTDLSQMPSLEVQTDKAQHCTARPPGQAGIYNSSMTFIRARLGADNTELQPLMVWVH